MAHGLSAVKEMFLDHYAEAFADAGFTTLVYDHFGFGASDGEPRQSPATDIQLQGYRDAISWLGGLGCVDSDRVGIWGSSLSGALVITLASEALPVVCAVAQVPGLGEGGPLPPAGALALLVGAADGGDPDATMPAVSETTDGDGLMFADGAYEWFTRTAAERAPAWRNELLVRGVTAVGSHRAIDDLASTRVPLLLVVAPDDTLTPPGPAMEVIASTPLVEVVEIPGNHFDAYEAGFRASSGPAVDWFRTHLEG